MFYEAVSIIPMRQPDLVINAFVNLGLRFLSN